MKVAIIGLQQTGKKTLFALLTGTPMDHFHGRCGEFHLGTVKVADPRLDRLSAMYGPKRTRHAEIECLLAPAPPHDPKHRELWLNKLKEMDAFCHLVRAFEDAAVFHPKGSVDPLRDIEEMLLELTLSDLALVEKRLERIAQEQKKRFEAERAEEAAVLERLRPHLEAGKPLRDYPWRDADERRVRSLQFLTMKGLVTVLNCGESNFPDPALLVAARARLKGPRCQVCELCVKLEAEVAEIEDARERSEFLAALGIEEPAVHVLTRLLYRALGYICFFTTTGDEVRAWTIRHGATALEAAQTIHSDLARGFIRAEVIKYDDLVTAGQTGHEAEVRLREAGKLLLKGKDYVVEDGDVLYIRHSG